MNTTIEEFGTLINEFSGSSEHSADARIALENMLSSKPELINLCLNYLNSSGLTETNITSAITVLIRAITPFSMQDLNELRNILNANEEFTQFMVAIADKLMHTEESSSFQHNGAALFARVFGLEPDLLIGNLEEICADLGNVSFSINMTYITVLDELFALRNIQEFFEKDNQPVIHIFQHLASKVVDVASSPSDCEIELRYYAIKTLNNLLYTCRNKKVQTHFLGIFEILMTPERIEFLFSIQEAQLYTAIMELMTTIVKAYYHTNNKILNSVADKAIGRLQFFMNPFIAEPLLITLTFWREVINFEFRTLFKYITEYIPDHAVEMTRKQEGSHFYFEPHLEILTELFIQIMVNLDVNDQDIEDPIQNAPSMIACVNLSGMFALIPDYLFERLKEMCDSMIKHADEDWRNIHTALLIIYVLTSKIADPKEHNCDIVTSNRTYQAIETYITTKFEFMTGSAVTTNQRVRETALYAISVALSRYPNIMKSFAEPLFVINQIVGAFGPDNGTLDPSTDPRIILRCLAIIQNIAACFSTMTYNHPFMEQTNLLDQMIDRVKAILELPQMKDGNNVTQIKHAYEAINTLILHAPRQEEHFKSLLFKFWEEAPNNFFDQSLNPLVMHMRVAGIISNITCLITRLPNDIDYTPIVNGIIEMIDTQLAPIIEECLLTLTSILVRLDPNSDLFVSSIQTIIEKIHAALDLKETNSINSACTLINTLWQKVGPLLDEFFKGMVDHLFALIFDESMLPETTPPLLIALSNVLMGMVPADHKENPFVETILNDEELLGKFRSIMTNYRDNTQLSSVDKSSIDQASAVMTSICVAFRAYAKLWYRKEALNFEYQNEKGSLMELSKVSSIIDKLGYLRKETYDAALDMYMEFSYSCTRKNNTVLNRRVNYNVIEKAMKYKSLYDKAKNTKKKLGNT
ncbi:hypothetical protein TVAG_324520 [Trichomonas vaginalis G3]|uniref:Exportin-1 C-terminal domain-containing protein n=1 Tax=Trichomonas vaginalis (strain ATCC PRA-98 / G3) TaxID=412133 RepID=A2FFQ3_TRIV3|nr:armadillo (ARM) repeat-containing protein family [Trichomonas vaginalis G3]EAX96278.1 hypothetical protein TVAG_324520 [Trichomonas vaginalis G3]KAI5516281.1 armadillo (ARM) repeat-containing protein family [Trichomonas vaginalis G3]|eukprot:XP_001309208.1 hypothetical protein [Trichomonas vaginalis G3]